MRHELGGCCWCIFRRDSIEANRSLGRLACVHHLLSSIVPQPARHLVLLLELILGACTCTSRALLELFDRQSYLLERVHMPNRTEPSKLRHFSCSTICEHTRVEATTARDSQSVPPDGSSKLTNHSGTREHPRTWRGTIAGRPVSHKSIVSNTF